LIRYASGLGVGRLKGEEIEEWKVLGARSLGIKTAPVLNVGNRPFSIFQYSNLLSIVYGKRQVLLRSGTQVWAQHCTTPAMSLRRLYVERDDPVPLRDDVDADRSAANPAVLDVRLLPNRRVDQYSGRFPAVRARKGLFADIHSGVAVR
jgi:hypothetical protein